MKIKNNVQPEERLVFGDLDFGSVFRFTAGTDHGTCQKNGRQHFTVLSSGHRHDRLYDVIVHRPVRLYEDAVLLLGGEE